RKPGILEALPREIADKSSLQLAGALEVSPQGQRIAAGKNGNNDVRLKSVEPNNGNRPGPAASVRKGSKNSSLPGDSKIHKRATVKNAPRENAKKSALPNSLLGSGFPQILDLKAAEAYSG